MAGSTAAVVLRRVGLGCGVAGLLSAAVFAATQAPVARTGDALAGQKAPGAVGNVAGQVPAQHRQALKAPHGRASSPAASVDWWDANSGRVLAVLSSYDDPLGKVGLLVDGGPMPTAGHPFFTPLGTNGRACITCHQPSDGMCVSVAARGPVDGHRRQGPAVCRRRRHELPQPCHSRGARPIRSCSTTVCSGSRCRGRRRPPTARRSIRNSRSRSSGSDRLQHDPVYGLNSANPTISVFRRPRAGGQPAYVVNEIGDQPRPQAASSSRTACPWPSTLTPGIPTTMHLMADAREPTLRAQADDAAKATCRRRRSRPRRSSPTSSTSSPASTPPGARAGRGPAAAGGPAGLRAAIIATAEAGLLGDFLTRQSFQTCAGMGSPCRARQKARGPRSGSPLRAAQDLHVPHLLDQGLGASQLHRARQSDQANLRDLPRCTDDRHGHGERLDGHRHHNLPGGKCRRSLDGPQMPLFRVTCKPGVRPHPFLGRVIYTQDPGRALISGLCNDVGTIVMEQFRGLAARAPYFSNGSASDAGDAGRLLRPPLQHRLLGAGKAGSRQLSGGALMNARDVSATARSPAASCRARRCVSAPTARARTS